MLVLQQFDVVIDATGSSQGIDLAMALTRCMGTLVLKSTCSLKDSNQPQWSAIANDIVVNEKKLIGSRCCSLPVVACLCFAKVSAGAHDCVQFMHSAKISSCAVHVHETSFQSLFMHVLEGSW